MCFYYRCSLGFFSQYFPACFLLIDVFFFFCKATSQLQLLFTHTAAVSWSDPHKKQASPAGRYRVCVSLTTHYVTDKRRELGLCEATRPIFPGTGTTRLAVCRCVTQAGVLPFMSMQAKR